MQVSYITNDIETTFKLVFESECIGLYLTMQVSRAIAVRSLSGLKATRDCRPKAKTKPGCGLITCILIRVLYMHNCVSENNVSERVSDADLIFPGVVHYRKVAYKRDDDQVWLSRMQLISRADSWSWPAGSLLMEQADGRLWPPGLPMKPYFDGWLLLPELQLITLTRCWTEDEPLPTLEQSLSFTPALTMLRARVSSLILEDIEFAIERILNFKVLVLEVGFIMYRPSGVWYMAMASHATFPPERDKYTQLS